MGSRSVFTSEENCAKLISYREEHRYQTNAVLVIFQHAGVVERATVRNARQAGKLHLEIVRRGEFSECEKQRRNIYRRLQRLAARSVFSCMLYMLAMAALFTSGRAAGTYMAPQIKQQQIAYFYFCVSDRKQVNMAPLLLKAKRVHIAKLL